MIKYVNTQEHQMLAKPRLKRVPSLTAACTNKPVMLLPCLLKSNLVICEESNDRTVANETQRNTTETGEENSKNLGGH